MTELEQLANRDILTWAIFKNKHGNFQNFQELKEHYWSSVLNTDTNIDTMWCDGDSSPLTDWDYSSPQPETATWDLN